MQGGGYAAVCSSGMDRKAGRMADGSMPQYGRNAVSEKQCSCFSHEKNAERAAVSSNGRGSSLSDEQFSCAVKAGNGVQCVCPFASGIDQGFALQEMDVWKARMKKSVFCEEYEMIAGRLSMTVSAWLKTQGVILVLTSSVCTPVYGL